MSERFFSRPFGVAEFVRIPRHFIFLTLSLALCFAAGCNRADRWDISGKVTHGGQPVTQGHISFDPVTPGKGGGFARIVDGRYDTREQGRTIPAGRTRVTVAAYKGLANPKNPDSNVVLLFPAYVTEVDLPAETATMDFDVPADWGEGSASKGP